MRGSLFTRLLVSNLIIVILSLMALSSLLSLLVSRHLLATKETELVVTGQEIARITSLYMEGRMPEEMAVELLTTLDRFLDARIWVVNRRGLILLESRVERPGMHQPWRGTYIPTTDLARVLEGQTVTSRGTLPQFPGVTVQTAIVPLLAGDEVVGALVIVAPVTGLAATMGQIHRLIGASALAAAAMAVGASFLSSRSLARPLERIETAARAVAAGDFSTRLPERGDREVANLARSFNHMAVSLRDTLNDLNREKRRFEDLLSSMSDGVLGVDPEGDLVIVNPAARDMLLLDPDRALGCPVGDVLPAPLGQEMKATLGDSKPRSLTLDPAVSGRILAVYLSPIIAGDASIPGGAVALLQDISERQRLETMRREFIANVSHDLRTPLTTIRGFVEPLLDGTVTGGANRKRYLETIRDESLRLGRLLDDLLDLSRLEAGTLQLDAAPVDLGAVVSRVVDRFGPQAGARSIALSAEIDPGLPRALGDSDRIDQVLVNLLDNALKYTGAGGRVTVWAGEKDGQLEVRVSDTGRGIDPEHIDHVFDRFYKGDKSRGRSEPGAGLGLAIVRQLVEAQGGTAGALSTPGVGSTFYFSLPRAQRSCEDDQTPLA